MTNSAAVVQKKKNKTFQKTIDKSLLVCYNTYRKRVRDRNRPHEQDLVAKPKDPTKLQSETPLLDTLWTRVIDLMISVRGERQDDNPRPEVN
jgi:hypothetical protein